MRSVDDLIDNRYRILELVRKGGMGAVYRAFDEQEDRYVALKEVHRSLLESHGEFITAKFAAEVEMLRQLRHPQIPRVWDGFLFDGTCFIAMEFIEGRSLDKLQVSQNDAVRYGVQVCRILSYLHGQQVVHRDVKPSNVILRAGGEEVVLVDFGVARTVDAHSLGTVTRVGTIGYAPPEQLSGEVGPFSDIYALGATLYFLLSGRAPLPLRVCSPAKVQPHVLPQLSEVVEKATQQSPQARFVSAAEMESALRALLHLPELEQQRPALPRPAPPWLPLLWVAVTAVAAAACALWWHH